MKPNGGATGGLEVKIGSFSRLAVKCQECPSKDGCHNKRMEHVAYIIPETDSPCKPIDINMDAQCAEALLDVILQEIRDFGCAHGRP